MKKLIPIILLLSLCFSISAIDYQPKATIIAIPKTYTIDNVTLYGAILTDSSVTFTSNLMDIPPITAHLNMIGANVNVAYVVDDITLTIDPWNAYDIAEVQAYANAHPEMEVVRDGEKYIPKEV